MIRSARRLVKKGASIVYRENRGIFALRKEFGKKMSESVDKSTGVWYYT